MDFLERPAVVFVRLKEAVALDSALEAPEPVRFVFVLMGPGKADMDYHETGRAMAALMADKVSQSHKWTSHKASPRYFFRKVTMSASVSVHQLFNQAASQATSLRDLTEAVGDFMDCSIVIPPVEIQNEAVLSSIVNFQKKLLKDRIHSSEPVLDSKPSQRKARRRRSAKMRPPPRIKFGLS